MQQHWIDMQREEFKRLGVEGDWEHPTRRWLSGRGADRPRVHEVCANGTLYRGSKPVMWSVVEKTALAEAEVEYEDYTSDTMWVKFPVIEADPSQARGLLRGIASGVLSGHLDHDALDDSGQPRDQLFAEDFVRPL